MDPRVASFQKEADRSIQFLHAEFSKLQTGRANASILEHVEVEAYGQRMPLKGVASISVQDAKTIVVQPWDKSVLQDVEKALQKANLGNPVNDGIVLRIVIPPMTEERRRDLTKIVHTLAEDARISIRQHRQAVHDQLKEEKNEDVKRTVDGILQKHVDEANAKIDEARKKKEEELMKV